MEMKQALYGMTLLGIVAAAGLVQGNETAWQLAGLCAALAFVTEELRTAGIAWRKPYLEAAAFITAMASWAAASIAATSML
jgi:Na+-transporting NADH:ubiquinone oxidoreductase subunit NqrD